MKNLCGLLILFLATTLIGAGQAISVNGGSIQGTITDSTGAIVPDATIFILGNDTNSSKSLKSDSSGFYSLGPLTPGPYTVTVNAAGFEKLTVKTVVRTGTATNGNFRLAIGSSTETVEVNAGALQINTDQAGVSDVITKDQIDSLPVNGRNFLDLPRSNRESSCRVESRSIRRRQATLRFRQAAFRVVPRAFFSTDRTSPTRT